MNFKKRYLVFYFIVTFVVGILGAYVGLKILQPKMATPSQILSDKIAVDVDAPENMEKVIQAHELIKQHYLGDVDDEELIEGAIQGMLDTLEDPYSTYMDAEAMERFNEQIESSFQGIGAEVSMVDGKVTIVAPIKGSPAEKAGLRPNDQILKVDDEELEGLDLNEAVEKIRGEKGSEVVLKVKRAGASETFDITIVRDEIPLETVLVETKEINGKKTGLLTITSFSETTASEFLEQLTELEEDGIEGLIIDVRGNPGGLLDSVETILKQFIPKDTPYLQIEDRNGKKETFHSELSKKKAYPISVLINEGSASASEILAVALKEVGYDVVGTKSFGKGTVQQAVPLGESGTIKLTFYKWLSPKGNWINEKGVKPTIEVEQPDYYFANPIQLEDKETLSYDQTNEKIASAQMMLLGLGYEIKRNDGYFDKQTETAVKSFQEAEKIKVTGKIDEQTASLIETKIVEKIRNGEDDVQLENAMEKLYK